MHGAYRIALARVCDERAAAPVRSTLRARCSGRAPAPLPSIPPLVVPDELATDLRRRHAARVARDATASAASPWARSPGRRRAAITPSCARRRVRRSAAWCWSIASKRPPSSTAARYDLSANFYPGAVHPEGYRAIVGFRLDPWPTWTLRAGGARHRALAVHAARAADDGRDLAPRRVGRRRRPRAAVREADDLGARLSRAAPRERRARARRGRSARGW